MIKAMKKRAIGRLTALVMAAALLLPGVTVRADSRYDEVMAKIKEAESKRLPPNAVHVAADDEPFLSALGCPYVGWNAETQSYEWLENPYCIFYNGAWRTYEFIDANNVIASGGIPYPDCGDEYADDVLVQQIRERFGIYDFTQTYWDNYTGKWMIYVDNGEFHEWNPITGEVYDNVIKTSKRTTAAETLAEWEIYGTPSPQLVNRFIFEWINRTPNDEKANACFSEGVEMGLDTQIALVMIEEMGAATDDMLLEFGVPAGNIATIKAYLNAKDIEGLKS